MKPPPIRPNFVIPLSRGADEVMAILRERLKGVRHADCSRSKGRCADLFLDEDVRRLWSPYLSIQVERQGERALLRGRYAPHPEIWTLFMFLYAAVGFLTVMGLMLGFVQWQSGMDPWGLWGFYAGLPGLALLYGVSVVGQRLSAHQIGELRDRMEELLDGLMEEEPPAP